MARTCQIKSGDRIIQKDDLFRSSDGLPRSLRCV